MFDDEVQDRAPSVLPRVQMQLHTARLHLHEAFRLRHRRRLALGARGQNGRLLTRADSAGTDR